MQKLSSIHAAAISIQYWYVSDGHTHTHSHLQATLRKFNAAESD